MGAKVIARFAKKTIVSIAKNYCDHCGENKATYYSLRLLTLYDFEKNEKIK